MIQFVLTLGEKPKPIMVGANNDNARMRANLARRVDQQGLTGSGGTGTEGELGCVMGA